MKKKVVVLGCGLVGATIARDLAEDEALEVAVVDLRRENLDKLSSHGNIHTLQADLGASEAIKAVVADCDLVAGAMPSIFGLQTLKAVIESGKPFADISFMIEDPTQFDDLAKQNGVTVVYDCGVAPGLANMAIGYRHSQFDQTTNVVYYVGGLPKCRTWPFEYKAPFSPSDVVEEYTRPARLMENGRIVTRPALSEPELIDFPEVGTLEGFNTDGLRSLLTTIDAPNMREKTLRYPGHCELMRAFRETGLFGKEEIEVRGVKVRPLDLTSKLMFSSWRLEPGEAEFTILRVIVEGLQDGNRLRHTYDLYDEYDEVTGNHSMARTTGFPCAILLRLIGDGTFAKPGVFPPEIVGSEPGIMDRMQEALAARGVSLRSRTERLEGPEATC